MLQFPTAKINLGLHILRQREDGFHDIDTIMYPLPLSDAIEGEISKSGKTLTVYNADFELPTKKNLVFKAWQLLHEKFDIPAIEFHLLKNIPSQSGLGGASADAVAAMKICNSLLNMNLNERELEYYASMLGSDCPFFVKNIPAIASGRGELLTPLKNFSLKGFHVLIVKPKTLHDGTSGISTAMAYSNATVDDSRRKISDIILEPMDKWKDLLVNDFQANAIKLYPEIGEIISTMYASGAIYASMTGSGSACYGIYKEKPENLTFSGTSFFIFESEMFA